MSRRSGRRDQPVSSSNVSSLSSSFVRGSSRRHCLAILSIRLSVLGSGVSHSRLLTATRMPRSVALGAHSARAWTSSASVDPPSDGRTAGVCDSVRRGSTRPIELAPPACQLCRRCAPSHSVSRVKRRRKTDRIFREDFVVLAERRRNGSLRRAVKSGVGTCDASIRGTRRELRLPPSSRRGRSIRLTAGLTDETVGGRLVHEKSTGAILNSFSANYTRVVTPRFQHFRISSSSRFPLQSTTTPDQGRRLPSLGNG